MRVIALVVLAGGGASILTQVALDASFQADQARRRERENAFVEFGQACDTATDVASFRQYLSETSQRRRDRFLETIVTPEPAEILRPKVARVNTAFSLALDLPDTAHANALADYCTDATRRLSARMSSALW